MKILAPHSQSLTWRGWLSFGGWILLFLWAIWWILSLKQGRLIGGQHTWIPVWPWLGLDFWHNYLGANHWLAGGNPYIEDIGDPRGRYAYPPVVLPMFAWCGLVSFYAATGIWVGFIAVVVSWAAWMCQRVRRQVHLDHVPFIILNASILLSTPVFFAMERGNSDVLVLLMILIAVWILNGRPSPFRNAWIGICLALGAWIKIYPVLLIVGLLTVRARRAFLFAILAGAGIGLISLRATFMWMKTSQEVQSNRISAIYATIEWLKTEGNPQFPRYEFHSISVTSHSLSSYWHIFWQKIGWEWISTMPGLVGATLTLLPLTAWVSYRLYRSTAPLRLVYPYMLWLAAGASFGMPESNDYNLFFLPLCVLAVWGRRDPIAVHWIFAFLFIWWQPFILPVPSIQNFHVEDFLFFIKFAGLIAAGTCLIRRADELEDSDRESIDEPIITPMTAARPNFLEGAH